MPKFRKKPVVIEAVPVADLLEAAAKAWKNLPDWARDHYENGCLLFLSDGIDVLTPEGRMRASPTDWLICGVKGEVYPIKDDIFKATYEAVLDPMPV